MAGGPGVAYFREFLQRELQRRFRVVHASLRVGAAWALWHLPILFVADSPPAQAPVPFLLSLVAVSVIYGWLYNRTVRSVLFVALFHATGNAVGVLAVEAGLEARVYITVESVVVLVAAVAIVLVTDPDLAAHRRVGRR